ncbi:MAG: MmcQ/YjbR family DNA-binding protein [Anaerolineaceae bacterium]|nr:MmcQ/YjbR family DNA-binding protein [Anaerolineaceae bacterium]
MERQTEGLTRLRAICLALPEASEQGGVGDPTFKVRDKIFAMRHPAGENRESLWCKAQPGLQGTLVTSEPERFFVPPYVGHHGWIGVWLDVEQDWNFIESLIIDSYCITAPKRLIKLLKQAPKSGE